MRRFAILFSVAVAAIAPLQVAKAQPAPTADQGQRADDLNAEGKKLAEAGKLDEARTKLEQAWALKHAYDIGGNLARVEGLLGHSDRALELVEAALRMFPASGKAEHKKGLEAQQKELRAKVVAVDLSGAPEGTHITINGRDVGKTPVEGAVYAIPPDVKVHAEREGYLPLDETAPVVGGTARPELKFVAIPGSAPPRDQPPHGGGAPIEPTPPSRPQWPAFVGYGLTAGALAAGVGTLVAANGTEVKGCSSAADCTDQKDKKNALSNASVWTLVAAGGLAAASTIYLVWSFGGHHTVAASTSLKVAPLPGGATAILRF